MTKFRSFIELGHNIDKAINEWQTSIGKIKILNWQMIKYNNSQCVCVLIEYVELDEENV